MKRLLLAAGTAVLSVLILLVLARDWQAPSIVGEAVIRKNPNPAAPLAAVVSFEVDEPAAWAIQLNGAPVASSPYPEFSTKHAVPILGLEPGSSNAIRISLADAAGNTNTLAADLQYVAPSLPEDFPPLRLAVSQSKQLEPGVTLFNVTPHTPPSFGLILAVDGDGSIVWYYRSTRAIGHLSKTPRGTLLFLERTDAVEIDMLGNTIARWHPTGAGIAAPNGEHVPVSTNLFHHEIRELPEGTLVSLSHEIRRVESFPTSETDPDAGFGHATLVADTVVEFSRDGKVVRELSLLDALDPARIGYDSLSGFWDSTYKDRHGPTRDWSHANSLSYVAEDDAFLVSLRSQDAVVKLHRSDGSLDWILGVPGGWQPPWTAALLRAAPGVRWFFHQHAAAMTPRGTLLLFDNGNHQARPFEPKQPMEATFSRAVEYAIDPPARSAREVWSYGGPGDNDLFFSGTLGGAEMLARTGNVLITDGARVTGKTRWARILEVTHDKPANKVLELIVGEPGNDDARGWSVYRAIRVAGLY